MISVDQYIAGLGNDNLEITLSDEEFNFRISFWEWILLKRDKKKYEKQYKQLYPFLNNNYLLIYLFNFLSPFLTTKLL